MRTLLYIIAILLIAAGVAVGLGSFYAPGQVVIGLNLEAASILLTGGFIMLGLATVSAALLTVAEALAGGRPASSGESAVVGAAPAPPEKEWPGHYGRRKAKAGGDLPGFLRPARGPSMTGPAKPPGLGPAQPPPSPGGLFPDKPVRKSEPIPSVIASTVDAGVPDDLQAAVEREAPSPDRAYPPEPEVVPPTAPPPAPATSSPAAPPPAAAATQAQPTTEDQLYVIEERLVRGKVARVLSDGTVEAETAEGWMRFENVEHLEEYLQAMGEV
jgi:hypothetical protein